MNGMCPLKEYNNMMLGIGLIGINEKELVISVTNHYLYVLYPVIFVCLNVTSNLIVGRAVWP